MISRLVVASKNPEKVREIEAILRRHRIVDAVVKGLDWPEVIEHGSSLEDNALLKARAVTRATGLPALADDTGLEVDALGGAPGVRTARFAGPEATYEDNVRALLEALQGVTERQARFRTVVVLACPDGLVTIAEGALEGVITTEPRGSLGFGYDPVFEVGGRTLAEMSPKEKNAISHRNRALEALVAELGSGGARGEG
jgi:XTP/dITP diphosphohydrolase